MKKYFKNFGVTNWKYKLPSTDMWKVVERAGFGGKIRVNFRV